MNRQTDRAAAANPPKKDDFLAEGIAQLQSGQPAEAVETFRRLLTREPRNELALLNLGIALMNQGHWREAAEKLRVYLDHHPDDALAHVQLGVALRHMKNVEGAMQEFRAALQWDKKCAAAYCSMGEVYLDQKKYMEAKEGFKWAIRYRPRYADAICGIAQAYSGLGLAGPAVHILSQALKEAKPAKAGRLYIHLARIYLKHEHWSDAISAFEKGIALGEDDENINFDLGVAYLRSKKKEAAMLQVALLKSLGSGLAPRLEFMISHAEPAA